MQLKPSARSGSGEASRDLVVSFLRSVRVRQFGVSLLSNWIASVSAVMLLGSALLLSRRTWLGSTSPTLELSDIALYGALATLLATVAALVWTLVGLPSVGALARRVDEALGLGALVSTAIEHVPRVPAEALPVRAMFEEVHDRLSRSQPAAVVQPRFLGWYAVLPMTLGVLALSALLPLEHLSSRSDEATVLGVSPDQVSADLDLLASLLEQEAAETDVGLERLVPELRQFRDEVVGAGLVNEAAAKRLGEVMESLSSAAATSETTLGRQLAAAFEEVAANRPDFDAAEQPFRFGSDEPPSAAASADTVDQQGVVKSPDFDPASVFRTLGRVASALERQAGAAPSEPGSESAGVDRNRRSSTGYYTSWDEEMAAEQAAKRAAIRERGRGEAVAGEAAQSDDSMGDAAGRGAQPIDSGAAETAASLLDLATEEFTVVADIRDGGDTNSYLPEPVEGRPLESGMSTELRDSLVAGNEVPISSESIVSGNRDVIAAFFGRSATEFRSPGTR